MIDRRRFMLGAAAACASMATRPVTAAVAGTHVLTATDVHVKGYPTVAAMEWIGDTMVRETQGRVRLRIYHSGQLGRESDAIDMARFGAIDLTRVYSGALNNAFPLTQALCLPYLFDSVAHLRRVIDGDVGAEILADFARRDLVGLAIYDSGPRCFYNTHRALHAPHDLAGLKFRVPPSDIFIRLLRLFGANPTPLSYGEVFSALETRLIDGAENNIVSFHASRQFEAARYWSQSDHSYAPDVLLISRRSLDALARADRDLLVDAARASVKVLRATWDAKEAVARGAVIAAGVAFNAVDGNAFRRAAQPLLQDYVAQRALAPLVRRLRDLATE